MKRRMMFFGVVLMLALVGAAPAFAVNGSGGVGLEFGQHHATHAQEMTGFSGSMNPGAMHKGFSGWTGV